VLSGENGKAVGMRRDVSLQHGQKVISNCKGERRLVMVVAGGMRLNRERGLKQGFGAERGKKKALNRRMADSKQRRDDIKIRYPPDEGPRDTRNGRSRKKNCPGAVTKTEVQTAVTGGRNTR